MLRVHHAQKFGDKLKKRGLIAGNLRIILRQSAAKLPVHWKKVHRLPEEYSLLNNRFYIPHINKKRPPLVYVLDILYLCTIIKLIKYQYGKEKNIRGF